MPHLFRSYLLSLALCFVFVPAYCFSQDEDRIVCNRILSFSFEHKLFEKPMGTVIGTIGKRFVGSPYEPNTLEQPGAERLVVNLHSFDCMTFVENVLALSSCIKKDRLSFDEFQKQLKIIRYRGGKIQGYASRLHYFSEWVYDNQRKGILRDMTREFGGVPLNKRLNFMSRHRQLYRGLADSSAFLQIQEIEDTLGTRQVFYIPKSAIVNSQFEIKTGDILAMTTAQEGLDVAHTGIAIRLEDHSLHYLHAPNVKGKVTITGETLSQYLQKHSSFTGIIVARVLEPSE